MKNRRITNMSMAVLALLMSCIMGTAQAAEILVDSSVLERAMDVIGTRNTESATVQEEINRLANSASSTFEDFKRQNDALEALLVLNAGLRKSVSLQEAAIVELDESIAGVDIITREVPLLMEKMLSSIEQFIQLDFPFQSDQRANQIQFARDAIDNPDVSIAEKFRQVLAMYQNEAQYGRTNDTYAATIDINGTERDVSIVRIGRVALMYQTTDRQVTGAWDNNARQWVELGAGEYRTAVQTAIRVASSLDAPKIIELPVMAPELAQ